MVWVIGRRLLQAVLVLIGASIIAFGLLNVLPGSTAIAILGADATPSSINIVNQQLGLNKPLVIRYLDWLGNAVHGNLGSSFITQQSVLSTVAARVPVSLELVIGALLVALATAIPAALISVRWRHRLVDRAFALLSVLGLSVPNFIVALVLVLVLAVKLPVFPSTGFIPLSESVTRNIETMVLPVLSLSFVFFGTYTRLLRADMLQQLEGEDYVLFGRSKGASETRILLRHVLKNASFNMIMVVGTNLGTLIGTTVIIEEIFGLPGVGQLMITSIFNRDAPVVQGVVLVLAVVVVLANLASDLLHEWLDPRTRYASVEAQR
jgi:peptide/nickel transport system permease protein